MSELQQRFPRFRVMARIEHIILLVSFTILAITGLPQRYPESAWGDAMIAFMGGIETIRVIHRYSAFILVLGSFYHLFTSAYRLFVKRERMRILPRMKDVTDTIDMVRYNLGLIKEHPKMTKFNFAEKVEYWAVVWGTAVMAITGFMLWNPIAVTNYLPGQVIPAAKTAHSAEALLAVLSILIWHFYHVLIKVRNWSMFTGWLPREQMEEEHILELERLEAGGDPWPGAARPVIYRRRRIFIVASIVLGAIIFVTLVWLFTFEETAITTLPAMTREPFVPLETPVP
ncbi:MAG: cytochrome b/b6 domain-containing protein [Candidatus Promineifilaceae bacterium]|nr:cytochrome b/b6 domain-containing protein [Candidatus Promineifilaceae bacterium]